MDFDFSPISNDGCYLLWNLPIPNSENDKLIILV